MAKLYPGGTQPPLDGTIAEFIDGLNKLPLAHQPGTAFEYGFSIDVLGAVVEKITAQRLGENLQANVWAPLGMIDTMFTVPESKRARLAHPFATDPLTGKPKGENATGTKKTVGGRGNLPVNAEWEGWQPQDAGEARDYLKQLAVRLAKDRRELLDTTAPPEQPHVKDY